MLPNHDFPGGLRLGEIKDASADSLHPFINANLAPEATLRTVGWAAYPGVRGFKPKLHAVGLMAAHIVLPSVHCVIVNLKTWALGNYQLATLPASLVLLDEFVFRFNRRRPHATFQTLLGIEMTVTPHTYKMLIAPEAGG